MHWTSVDTRLHPTAVASGLDAQGSLGELHAALRAVLLPLARLAVAQGLPYAQAEALLKLAFLEAGREAHGGHAQRAVSRISAATGLSRREVTRLLQRPEGEPARRRSPATELFTRWLSDPALRTPEGRPMALPRQGPAPSFESLAQAVTRDVHPRSLLEELCRLGLAELDAAGETVHLLRETYVPQGDLVRMLGFLGANVGDHFSAAVANVLTDGKRHFEQALFADELSGESLEQVRRLVTEQWQALLTALVPAITRLIEEDRAAGRAQDQRLRIGLYTYTDAMPAASGSNPPSPPSDQEN